MDKSFISWSKHYKEFHTIMESNDRKNVYLAKTGDNSLNSGMRDTMIVGQTNMTQGEKFNLIYLKIFIKYSYKYIHINNINTKL